MPFSLTNSSNKRKVDNNKQISELFISHSCKWDLLVFSFGSWARLQKESIT